MKINSIKNLPTNNALVKTNKISNKFKQIYQDLVQEHKNNYNLIENSLQNKNYNINNLLKIQFHTGLFFFKEQTFCKAAELSASSLKSITQMHI